MIWPENLESRAYAPFSRNRKLGQSFRPGGVLNLNDLISECCQRKLSGRFPNE